MKITICGSIAFYDEMQKIKEKLNTLGHNVDLPPIEVEDDKGGMISVKKFYDIRKSSVGLNTEWVNKRKKEAMKKHFDKVAWADAVLILNYTKNDIPNYIGANTFLEIGVAFYLNKVIYLLNSIPETNYQEEVCGMDPIILNGDLSKIK